MDTHYLHGQPERGDALAYVAKASPIRPLQGVSFPFTGADDLPARVLAALAKLAAADGGHWSRTRSNRAKARFGWREPMVEVVVVPPRRYNVADDPVFDAGGLFPLAAVIAQRGRRGERHASSVAFVSELAPIQGRPFERVVLRVLPSLALLGIMRFAPSYLPENTSTKTLVTCWQLGSDVPVVHLPWPEEVHEPDLRGVLPELSRLPDYLTR